MNGERFDNKQLKRMYGLTLHEKSEFNKKYFKKNKTDKTEYLTPDLNFNQISNPKKFTEKKNSYDRNFHLNKMKNRFDSFQGENKNKSSTSRAKDSLFVGNEKYKNMLLKSGWNGKDGLGKNQQGNFQPVAFNLKTQSDKQGIGFSNIQDF